jgi:hypothetical protein
MRKRGGREGAWCREPWKEGPWVKGGREATKIVIPLAE